MTISGNKVTAITAALSFALTPAAQRQVAPPKIAPPTDQDIVIAADGKADHVTCTGVNSVFIRGQHNEVQVYGRCRFVLVQGNENHIWVDQDSLVSVEGNDNTIFVSNPQTSYANKGNNNRYELAKH